MRCDADGNACADIGTGSEQTYTVSSRDAGQRLRVKVVGTNDQGSAEATSQPTAVVASPTDPNSIPRTPNPQPGAQSPQDRGAPNGSGASDRVRLSAFFGRARRTTVRTRYGRSARVSGQLLDAENRPISDATLSVMAEPRVRASQMDDLGTVRTDGDGRFSYTVSAGPSRLVRIGYRSHTGDTQFADTTDVLVLVQAGVSLRPSPRKLRNGNVGTFTGRAAQPIPLRGVLVDLQVRVGRQWRTFAVVRTGRDGRYSYRHRFRNTFVKTTFRFRARVRRETDYPYIIGYSRIAKLRVRP
jgi:5-hydroxyisourate hydrolase-like protein (transthyretin family)